MWTVCIPAGGHEHGCVVELQSHKIDQSSARPKSGPLVGVPSLVASDEVMAKVRVAPCTFEMADNIFFSEKVLHYMHL